ncbi:MAG: hypothetical protein MJ252_05365, partial [archaeon]|nr:hypothetical protein [archaeon]
HAIPTNYSNSMDIFTLSKLFRKITLYGLSIKTKYSLCCILIYAFIIVLILMFVAIYFTYRRSFKKTDYKLYKIPSIYIQ